MLNSCILEGYVITVSNTSFVLRSDELVINVTTKTPINLLNGQNVRIVGRLKNSRDAVCFSAEHIEIRGGLTRIIETEELEI